MMEPTFRTARGRFVTEAARLFSAQGYAATSVADIQLACGLTGGSGALYKHFPSKRRLLEEVIGTHIATMRAGSQSFGEQLPDDLAEALRWVARAVWAGMQRDQQALRVTLRDLDNFPELLDEIWAEIRANVYGQFTRWLRDQMDRGTVRVADPAATAAVLLASLTYHPILDTLIGHTPGDIDAGRFADAWVQHAVATLRP
jgi:AcrR family transcriptional regulator